MKKSKNNVFKVLFFAVTIISVFFFLMEREAYHPETPPFIGSIAEPFREKGVFVQAKAYNAYDSRVYLSRDLSQSGFKPIQVTIQNNTEKTYLLSTKGVSLPNASTSEVANKVTSGSIPRSIGFKVAGFLFWPFIIPGTIDSIMTVKSHFKMKKDYHAKSIKDHEEALPPYSMVNRILFLPENQTVEEFTLYLKEFKSNQRHPFEVKISK